MSSLPSSRAADELTSDIERHIRAICRGSYSCYHTGMTPHKQRLTVTVDPGLIEAGNRAVASGEAESLSGWVSAALSDRVQRDRKLESLRIAIADYEAEYGEITAAELAAQRRADREDAVVVRGRGPGASSATRKAGRVKSA